MHRQDTPQTDLGSETHDPFNASESTSLGRRRALLSGLSKGGALVAAAAPVSSFAAGRVKTADGKQCTVSGQMSAVMSQAASANPCAAFHPTYFYSTATLTIAQVTDAPLKTALQGMAIGAYANRADAVYFKRNATEARKITPDHRPGGYGTVGLTVVSIFPGATTQKVLRQMHARPDSDVTYFLAAFFSAALSPPSGAEKVPFPAANVVTQWSGTKKVEAATFYKLICTEGMNTSNLG